MRFAYLHMSVAQIFHESRHIRVSHFAIHSDQLPTTLGEEYVELMRAKGEDFESARELILEAVRGRMNRSPFWRLVAESVVAEDVKRKALAADAQRNPRGIAARTSPEAPVGSLQREIGGKSPFGRFHPKARP